MTAKEFERAFAEMRGITVDWLHTHGYRVEVCDCEDEGCDGWVMGYSPAHNRSYRVDRRPVSANRKSRERAISTE
jgi:hypothetical protein